MHISSGNSVTCISNKETNICHALKDFPQNLIRWHCISSGCQLKENPSSSDCTTLGLTYTCCIPSCPGIGFEATRGGTYVEYAYFPRFKLHVVFQVMDN